MNKLSDLVNVNTSGIKTSVEGWFGLDNNSDSYSVMCSFYTPCYVYLPSQADHNGLNAIYNN